MAIMARMRTLQQCHAMLLEADPESAVTKHFLYQGVRSGRIPSIMAGNKRLINFDLLMEMLDDPATFQPAQAEPPGKIRRIK